VIAPLVAGLVAGYGIAIPVGAVGAYLVSLTARTSLRTGMSAALGVATADGVYALVAVAGGAALVGVLEPVTVPLKWASGLVLAVLAVLGAVTAVRQYRSPGQDSGARPSIAAPGRAYLSLLGITLLNPMTVVYFTALVLGSGAAVAQRPWERGVFVLAAFAASASWQLLLAGGGALLGRALTGRLGRLVTALVSSGVITVLAVRMLATP